MRVQVEALEHDKHVITDAFERVLASLQASLSLVLQMPCSFHTVHGVRTRQDGEALSQMSPPLALLQGDLSDVKGRLEALRRERDG